MTTLDLAATRGPNGTRQVVLGRGSLTVDAFGLSKVSQELSLLHGMFTYGIPVFNWKESVDGVEQAISVATSINGKMHLPSTVGVTTRLASYRHPRYEPNRGLHYSSSIFLPVPDAIGTREFGIFTAEAGAFFRLRDGVLYAVLRTTVDGTTIDREELIKDIYVPRGVDLSKGNIYDIQLQWRGVGDMLFYIGDPTTSLPVIVHHMRNVNRNTELSSFNPAFPIAFECTGDVVIESGCVDLSTEGGKGSAGTYGSITTTGDMGEIAISGFNMLVMAIRSLTTVGGRINTRDIQNLNTYCYSNNRSLLRVWVTRDPSAIALNGATWTPFRDGNVEYVEPAATLDTTKATLLATARVPMDSTVLLEALFDSTELFLTPGDILVFTVHRETGGNAKAGITYTFSEDI